MSSSQTERGKGGRHHDCTLDNTTMVLGSHHLLVDLPVVLPRRPDLLLLPFDPDRRHPLLHKMILMT